MIVLSLTRVYRKSSSTCHLMLIANKNRRGQYGQDLFTLRSIFLRGQPPPSVNMYWRRYAVKDIPLDTSDHFDAWLQKVWTEKNALMEQYLTTGRFPPNAEETDGIASTGQSKLEYIETEVKPHQWWEVAKTFTILFAFAMTANLGAKIWNKAF